MPWKDAVLGVCAYGCVAKEFVTVYLLKNIRVLLSSKIDITLSNISS